MYKSFQHKTKQNFFALGFKNVKQSLLIQIALLVSVLINLPRVLQLFNLIDNLADSFAQATLKDVIVRALFLVIFSWLVLQFNANWKFIYSNYSRLLNTTITILVNTFLFFSIIFLFIFIHQIITGELMNSSDKGLLYFMYFVVLVILVFVSRILRYQISRQEDIAEKEMLQRQSLQNELTALKNQINPHFLFNSLNSLNSLVRDNKEATSFINKLSFMYRYILQSGSQDMVTLKEELKFLESYTFLINVRYRERFQIDIQIEEQWLNERVPALALQLLVENAVKHNEISESNPLQVKIYVEENNIVVSNLIKPRTTFVDSTGNGLANLDKRYMILKKEHIVISDSDNIFKVKLPLKR